MNLATAGHVDHGKTSLVKALTGADTDRLAEEKKRGLTIDIGFAYMQSGQISVGFVDVPGHSRFIHNMLVGVGAIDAALLVVAADDGIMPQTREHLAILELLGIREGVLVITRADLADAERTGKVAAEVRHLVAGTCLADLPLFCTSSRTGQNLAELQQHLFSLAKRQQSQTNPRLREAFRMPVDRVFNVRGTGLIVTGSVLSGSLSVDEEVQISPAGLTARVRSLHAQNQPAETAGAGQRCAFNLAGPGIQTDAVCRGHILTAPGSGCITSRFDASLSLSDGSQVLKHWHPVHLHLGARHLLARVALTSDARLQPGETALVQIVTEEPVDLVFGDRFVIRNQSASATLGGGFVIDPFTTARGRARPERLARVRALNNPDPLAAAAAALPLYPDGLSLKNFFRRRNLPEPPWPAPKGSILIRDEQLAFDAAAWDRVKARLLASLKDCHKKHPQLPGLSLQELSQRLPGLPDAAVRLAGSELEAEARLARTGNVWHMSCHQVQLPEPLQSHWKQLVQGLSANRTQPPVMHDLARKLQLPAKEVQLCFTQAVRQGILVRVSDNRCLLPEALRELAGEAERLLSETGGFGLRDFCNATGLGRNFAIQVLEYFDGLGMTRREGDRRVQQRGFSELVS